MLNEKDAYEADADAQPELIPASAPDAVPLTKAADDTLPAVVDAETGQAALPEAGKVDFPDAGEAALGEPATSGAYASDTVASLEDGDEPPKLLTPDAVPLFTETGLSDPILRAIAEKGYLHPTPIQAQAIPVVLAGRDVLGVAQTGTGKTASFVLPMMDILSGSRARARMPRSLILEPTRELALCRWPRISCCMAST